MLQAAVVLHDQERGVGRRGSDHRPARPSIACDDVAKVTALAESAAITRSAKAGLLIESAKLPGERIAWSASPSASRRRRSALLVHLRPESFDQADPTFRQYVAVSWAAHADASESVLGA